MLNKLKDAFGVTFATMLISVSGLDDKLKTAKEEIGNLEAEISDLKRDLRYRYKMVETALRCYKRIREENEILVGMIDKSKEAKDAD